MDERYRMLGREHEADLEREALKWQRAAEVRGKNRARKRLRHRLALQPILQAPGAIRQAALRLRNAHNGRKRPIGRPFSKEEMRPPFLLLLAVVVSLLAGTGATAAGPPVVNETLHFVDEPFGGVTLNCGTGNLAEGDGVFSGVIRTFVTSDGTVRFSTHTRGTATLDDLPTDGIPDATTTFLFNTVDTELSSGREIHTETGVGTLTLVATGEELRFRAVAQLVVDHNGDTRVEFFRITCE